MMKKHPKTVWLLIVLTVMAFGMVAYANIAQAKDITINFKWDPDTVGGWEKINLYERAEGASYDYATKKETVDQTYVDGNSTPTEMSTVSAFTDGEVSTRFWVVRSQVGDLESADSEEVSFTADLTVLEQFDFTAVYNEETKTIDMAWNITDDRITRWEIYTSDTAGGPYEKLTEVAKADGVTPSYSVEGDTLFPAGEKTTKYFTMVAFAPYDIFSVNSPEVAITINKRPPSGVVNFKIILTQQ